MEQLAAKFESGRLEIVTGAINVSLPCK
jgi:hypothetical protein